MKKEKKKHSKKFKIIVSSVVIGVIALMATGLGFWFGFTDPALSKKLDVDPFYSRWMSNLKDEAKIVDVVIPGTHDAGTNGMMAQAMCQGHDIKDQLRGGARYFDLRVTKKGDDLVIFHGPIKGQKFSKVLNEINEFINDNPSEFLILDFQHFGDNLQEEVADVINSTLPMEKMLNSVNFHLLKEVDMQLIRENHFNFLITYSSSEEIADENRYYHRDTFLQSEYSGDIHKQSDEALINEFENYFAHADETKLFVLQAQRTAKTLLGKPSMYEKKFKNKVNDFIDGIALNPDYLNKANIIMRDFLVSDMDNVNKILKLNIAKELIKPENINSFSNFIK